MLKIDDVMSRFLTIGVQSVCRYVEIADLSPWDMPEFFMPAFIMDHLGKEITMTLETGFSTLAEWNDEIRKRRGLSERSPDERSLRLAKQLEGRRVDLVIFEGEEEHKPKEQQDIFAVVEFKGGWIDANRDPAPLSDRDKLLMLLDYLDTCPYGITCGWARESHIRWQKEMSVISTRDLWYEQKIDISTRYTNTALYFCARVFERSSDEGRIEELLSFLPDFSAARRSY